MMDTAFYNYTIIANDVEDIEVIAKEEIKSNFRENIELLGLDFYLLLAIYNEMYVGFNYTATCSTKWNQKVVLSVEEILDIIESLSGE